MVGICVSLLLGLGWLVSSPLYARDFARRENVDPDDQMMRRLIESLMTASGLAMPVDLIEVMARAA
jgi:hypothetical protein